MELVKDSLQKLHLVIKLFTKNIIYFVYIDLNCNITFAFNLRNNFNFIHALDNLCENALDLTNGNLIVDNNWPLGTYCQWLISAEDENSYITLDFQNINVS